MLRELAAQISSELAYDPSLQTPHSWIGLQRALKDPDTTYGGLFWMTDRRVSCAATLEGVDRLVTIAEEIDRIKSRHTLGTLRELSSRPTVLHDGDIENRVVFYRDSVRPHETQKFSYLAEVVELIPAHADESLREKLMDRLLQHG